MSYLDHLECSHCRQRYDADKLQHLCPVCELPLLARYDLSQAARNLNRDRLQNRPATLWRYRELLPVRDPAHIITLGEGGKPLLPARRLGNLLGLKRLFIKDEGQNPTGSFKALGLSTAVSRAIELGAGGFVIPTAGNAGSALAGYAARAGVPAHIYMPQDAPPIIQQEVIITGAHLHLVDGLITDAGRQAAAAAAQSGWFDVSTLKEPYRIEGKKIMGYEVAAALDWMFPDVIVYPTGGGTGLIGMWKAFAELAELGWVDDYRPRMVAVQSEGCAPVVKAFHEGAEDTSFWENAVTLAGGLRVPAAVGGRLMLQALRESNGTAVMVSDDAIQDAQKLLAASEGLFASLESAATVAGLQALVKDGWVRPDERIILFSTGSGLKHHFQYG